MIEAAVATTSTYSGPTSVLRYRIFPESDNQEVVTQFTEEEVMVIVTAMQKFVDLRQFARISDLIPWFRERYYNSLTFQIPTPQMLKYREQSLDMIEITLINITYIFSSIVFKGTANEREVIEGLRFIQRRLMWILEMNLVES